MDATGGPEREIVVPITIFGHLRRELEKEAGSLPAIHALHAAGYSSGQASAVVFSQGLPGGVAALPQEAFWPRLRAFFGKRGWGTLNREPTDAPVAILVSSDWAEADDAEPDSDASCSFTTGFLAGLLSELAGAPVAVLEVQCRTRGDARCTFAFGSEGAVHELYGQLLEGADLDGALSVL